MPGMGSPHETLDFLAMTAERGLVAGLVPVVIEGVPRLAYNVFEIPGAARKPGGAALVACALTRVAAREGGLTLA